MRIRLVLLTALAFAAVATVASGFQIRLPRQEKLLSQACSTAAAHIRNAVRNASSTQVQTIATELRVLKRGSLVGDIAFDESGSSITVAADAAATDSGKFNCGHGEVAGRLGVGRGPGHSHIVSTLNVEFTGPGLFVLTFTLNQTGRNMLARLGAAERLYRNRHPHGHRPPSIAWAVGLHYSPVR
jgi:hypothetical protein